MLLLESFVLESPTPVMSQGNSFISSLVHIVNPCKHAEENSLFIDTQIYKTKTSTNLTSFFFWTKYASFAQTLLINSQKHF
jgi:hypothetical protein